MATLNELANKRFEVALSRYNEENFFYIAHNYLGPIQSPFHKPQLISRLSHFFGLPQHQKRMLELLDELDQAILSLLLVSGPLSSDEVIDLLSPTWGYTTLFWRLSSLQLRLILIGEEGRLVFNSLIEKELVERCNLEALLGSVDGEAEQIPHLSVEMMRGYLALVLEEQRFGFRESHRQLFPAFGDEQLRPLITLLSDQCQRLGLFTAAKPIALIKERAKALLALSDEELLSLFLATTITGPPFSQAIAFSKGLVNTLLRLGSISEEALALLGRALAKRHGLSAVENLKESLLTLGVLLQDGKRLKPLLLDENNDAQELLVDSDFTISYLGRRDEEDLLHRFATLVRHDVQRQWRVTKASVVRAFDEGLTFQEIKDYLQEHTQGSSGTSLVKQMSLLDERYGMLTIYDGLTLVVDERVANLIEHLPALEEHRLQKLAPSIFLMRRDSEAAWRKILTDAGQLVGATRMQTTVPAKEESINPHFEQYIELAKTAVQPITLPLQGVVCTPLEDEALLAAIKAAKLNAAQQKDLLSRYEQHLIITASQITAQVLDAVVEASGLDYQGKLSLCRQAVGKRNITLQLFFDGEQLMVWALEITTNAEGEAFLKVAVLPSKEERVIPIRKIFTVRSLRTQLF
jgi:hypothetical protein